MNIAPSAATLGAAVTGVRLNALSDREWQAIEDAFHEHAVLVFPGANLTEAEHIAFSRRFGPLERTLSQRAERLEISLLSNVAKSGEIAKPDETLGLYLKGNRYWHTDSSFKKVPAKVSLLRALEVPETGGDTEWADMRAAWEALDPDTQQRLEGLVAVHSYAFAQGKIGGTDLLSKTEWDALPPCTNRSCACIRQPAARTSTWAVTHRTSSACRATKAVLCSPDSRKTPARRRVSFATIGGRETSLPGTTGACCIEDIPGRSTSLVS